MNVRGRIVLTAIVILVMIAVNWFVTTAEPLVVGNLDNQLSNSNSAYMVARAAADGYSWLRTVVEFAGLGALLLIWLSAITKFFKNEAVKLFAIAAVTGLLFTTPSYAYYSTTDRAEAYEIQSNESAFWLQDVGANEDNQQRLMSEEYLEKNAVSEKLVFVPHHIFRNSGGTGWLDADYYVPVKRLIIVDRTPYSREWVAAADRGTSAKNQGIVCQSSEGLDITVGIAISVKVNPEQAARFLYNFGIRDSQLSPEERVKPEIIFKSVYFGRSLEDVMDTTGHAIVSAEVCDALSQHGLEYDNAHAHDIMVSITNQTGVYLKSVGITLVNMGWSDTWTFSNDVQAAINRKFDATQDVAVAQMLQPYVSTIQALAGADALRNFGEKTDGHLPQTLVGYPGGVGNWLGALVTNSIGNNAPVSEGMGKGSR